MRWSRASWLVLVVFATTNVDAALTITDCSVPGVMSIPSVGADCAELKKWSVHYAAPVRSVLPDSGALDAILADLGHIEQPRSLWEHFTGWLSDRFRELLAALPEFPDLLRGLKWSWPGWLAAALLWSGGLLLAALAMLAVVALLRVLGVRRPAALQRAIAALRSTKQEIRVANHPAFTDLAAAPPGQRPRILLAILIRALRAAGRLGTNAALSHRQLGRAVLDVNPGQRSAIESIARLAERVTYSRFTPGDVELAQAVSTTHDLVNEVSG